MTGSALRWLAGSGVSGACLGALLFAPEGGGSQGDPSEWHIVPAAPELPEEQALVSLLRQSGHFGSRDASSRPARREQAGSPSEPSAPKVLAVANTDGSPLVAARSPDGGIEIMRIGDRTAQGFELVTVAGDLIHFRHAEQGQMVSIYPSLLDPGDQGEK